MPAPDAPDEADHKCKWPSQAQPKPRNAGGELGYASERSLSVGHRQEPSVKMSTVWKLPSILAIVDPVRELLKSMLNVPEVGISAGQQVGPQGAGLVLPKVEGHCAS